MTSEVGNRHFPVPVTMHPLLIKCGISVNLLHSQTLTKTVTLFIHYSLPDPNIRETERESNSGDDDGTTGGDHRRRRRRRADRLLLHSVLPLRNDVVVVVVVAESAVAGEQQGPVLVAPAVERRYSPLQKQQQLQEALLLPLRSAQLRAQLRRRNRRRGRLRIQRLLRALRLRSATGEGRRRRGVTWGARAAGFENPDMMQR